MKNCVRQPGKRASDSGKCQGGKTCAARGAEEIFGHFLSWLTWEGKMLNGISKPRGKFGRKHFPVFPQHDFYPFYSFVPIYSASLLFFPSIRTPTRVHAPIIYTSPLRQIMVHKKGFPADKNRSTGLKPKKIINIWE